MQVRHLPKHWRNIRVSSRPFTLAVIAAGEQSGHLDQVLENLAEDLQSQQTLRNKLLAATLYPAIVSMVALLIVFFLAHLCGTASGTGV
jgi:type II secretory pathway component PulF